MRLTKRPCQCSRKRLSKKFLKLVQINRSYQSIYGQLFSWFFFAMVVQKPRILSFAEILWRQSCWPRIQNLLEDDMLKRPSRQLFSVSLPTHPLWRYYRPSIRLQNFSDMPCTIYLVGSPEASCRPGQRNKHKKRHQSCRRLFEGYRRLSRQLSTVSP